MRYSFPLLNPMFPGRSSLRVLTIRKFLITICTLLVSCILFATIVVTFQVVSSYLNQAYSRNALFRAMAQADQINQMLVAARHELEYLSRTPLTPEFLMEYFAAKSPDERDRFCEVAFQGQSPADGFVLVNTGVMMSSVPLDQALEAKFGIFSGRDQLRDKSAGHIHISEPVEVIYPSLNMQGSVRALTLHVIRLTTLLYGPDNLPKGRLTLSVDLLRLRDILSIHSSIRSPLYLFPQDSEFKQAFFFDSAGWLLFQSDTPDKPHADLSVDKLRTGLQGDVGRPGFNTAFRPVAENNLYWSMVAEIQAGKVGQVLVAMPFMIPTRSGKKLYLSYIPIVFKDDSDNQRIVGGIGCLDSSFMFKASTYKIAWTLLFCLLVCILSVFFAMDYVGRRICRPLESLADAIQARASNDDVLPLAINPVFYEIKQFQDSINILLMQLRNARNDITLRKTTLENDRMRQQIDLEKEIRDNPALDTEMLQTPLFGIFGGSQAIGVLRKKIQKAAAVLADVLIVGETGTGKELTAESIHAMSHRSNGPFISINCGALDENLLMDTLFGHVKGAFSEAQTDRQGAFIAASGGTLLLDEIGNASPKVQQALLRSLSVRRIRPLGSDKDIAFDARIIAATNVDLLQLSLAGEFREDLYYRLAVITINLPPLRDRKEEIPVLIKHFLERFVSSSGFQQVGISRGALEKLMDYDWPGNVRELKNCLTRSLAFAEGDLLLDEHILFDERMGEAKNNSGIDGKDLVQFAQPEQSPGSMQQDGAEAGPSSPARHLQLNHRQRKAWETIAANGEINRSQYQAAVGETISTRTAQYDLHDLVKKGLLKKSGNGPSSRYVLAES